MNPQRCQTLTLLIAAAFASLCLPLASQANTVHHVPAEYRTIQAAIRAAVNGDEIIVAAGTYNEAIDLQGKAVHLHSSAGRDATIIDGTGLNTSVVTCASGETADTVIEGFTITHGSGKSGKDGYRRGGGMYNTSSATVIHCAFRTNLVTGDWRAYGGAIYAEGGSMTIAHCTFQGNSVLTNYVSYGGGIFSLDGQLTVRDSDFTANFARLGGALFCAGGTPMVDQCTLNANSNDAEYGSMCCAGCVPIVLRCTFNENSGRGLWASGSQVTVADCVFSANAYGGIVNFGEWLTATNSLFVANGGAALYSGGATTTMTHCTLSGNVAGVGHYAGGTTTLTNCIAWANGQEIEGETTVTYSNIRGGHEGPGNLSVDPRFQDPMQGDLRLLSTSPCIDAGDNAAVPTDLIADLDGNPRLTDVMCRPDTGYGTPPIVDMGAFEAQDEFVDCNENGMDDLCDMLTGTSADCNGNGVPDECDLAEGSSLDIVPPGGDSVPDECERVHNSTQNTYYRWIQSALDAAVGGDEIVVAPGTYNEAINLLGKPVYLHSSMGPATAIVDGSQLGASVVTCTSGENSDTVIEGFTVTGGSGTLGEDGYSRGGGILTIGSDVRINDCVVVQNSSWDYGSGAGMYNEGGSPALTRVMFSGNELGGGYGAGLHNHGGSPTLTDCRFVNNRAWWGFGAGMSNNGGSPALTNCSFQGNVAWQSNGYGGIGGGMLNSNADPVLINCTFVMNSAYYDDCGGITSFGGTPTIRNCILWHPPGYAEICGDAVVTYSNVRGGYPGVGNIDADPLFVDPANGDFRLAAGSPCIDAGDPAFIPPAGALRDLDGRLRIWDGNGDSTRIVDMGGHEFAAPAFGDLNCDGAVNNLDVDAFVLALADPTAYALTYPGCEQTLADVNGDGAVNNFDIDAFLDLISGG